MSLSRSHSATRLKNRGQRRPGHLKKCMYPLEESDIQEDSKLD